MKKILLVCSLIFALGASQASAADDLEKFKEDSHKTVKELMMKLSSAMQKEMTEKGPTAAIKVCIALAPSITSDISRKTGERVTRVSLKVRNPLLGTPDAWEQKVLLDFEARAEKENPATLEYAEITTEPQGRFLRYMKAIPTQKVCLTCHGTPETIPLEVKKQLTAEYPHDKATGYTAGQIRGAFSIKKAL